MRHRAESQSPPERFPVSFYIVAMLFIMFDIEIIFIYPFAVSPRHLGMYGFCGDRDLLGAVLPHVRVRGRPRRARLGSAAARSGREPSDAPRCAAVRWPTHGVGDADHHVDHPPRRHRGPPRDRARRGGLTWVCRTSSTTASAGCRTTSSPASSRPRQLGPCAQLVAGVVRPGLLRHRDDGDRRRPLRHLPLRHGGVPGVAPPGRHHDRRRPGEPEDGSGAAPGLRPDDGAQVGHLDGRVRIDAAACSTTTRSCRASTRSCRSTCTRRAARRRPRR